MKDQVAAFLGNFMFCVMATVAGDGKPEAAFVGFRHNQMLELLIGTSRLSRKYQNLQQNSHVALVFADTSGEVQYEGTATEVSPEEYDQLIATGQFEALPGTDKYRKDPDQVYLKVMPTWVRFIQHGENDLIEEMTEF